MADDEAYATIIARVTDFSRMEMQLCDPRPLWHEALREVADRLIPDSLQWVIEVSITGYAQIIIFGRKS